MFIRTLMFACVFLMSAIVHALPETPEQYVEVFNSGLQIEKEKATETLAWAGISSPKLFDLLEAEALAMRDAKDKVSLNYLAWLLRGLGFSGNEKYRPTLENFSKEAKVKKIRKYATLALKDLPLYAELNPKIAPKAWPEHPHPGLRQRLYNMLESNNAELQRIAGKRVHYTHDYDADMLKALAKTLEDHYQKNLDDNGIDAIAWVCKALAGSRAVEFKPLVEKVSVEATEPKLRKYAKKYLDYYGG